jgi:hypothetical protein
MDTYTPFLLQTLNQAGAFPLIARAYRDLLERNMNEFPEDQAERMMPALIMESR